MAGVPRDIPESTEGASTAAPLWPGRGSPSVERGTGPAEAKAGRAGARRVPGCVAARPERGLRGAQGARPGLQRVLFRRVLLTKRLSFLRATLGAADS